MHFDRCVAFQEVEEQAELILVIPAFVDQVEDRANAVVGHAETPEGQDSLNGFFLIPRL
ncbi:hypothetical protein D3C75_1280810 [compost metagenome]